MKLSTKPDYGHVIAKLRETADRLERGDLVSRLSAEIGPVAVRDNAPVTTRFSVEVEFIEVRK